MERILLELRLRKGCPLSLLREEGLAAAGRALSVGLLEAGPYEEGHAVLTLWGRLLADWLGRGSGEWRSPAARVPTVISGGAPAADATILRYGLRRFLGTLPFVPITLVSGGTGVYGAVYSRDSFVAGWGAVLFILMALLFSIPVVGTWRTRRWVMAFDATGFWWIRGKEIALIPWESLAGVGIYCTHRTFTVELCPRDEIDRDDPLLWGFVRDTEPLRPGLPRLRYRIGLPHSFKPYEKALRQWAPELWFGRVVQPLSYAGQPDRAGHRERMARRQEG